MGHSYLDFNGCAILIKDSSIEMIVKLIKHEWLIGLGKLSHWCDLSSQLETWETAVKESGVGCIELPLDNLLCDARVLDLTLKLVDAAESTIKSFGDSIPLSFLQASIGPEYHREVEAGVILRDLYKFRALLIKGSHRQVS